MSEIRPSCPNGTPGSFNRSWSGWHHYQVIGAAETIILPCLIGIICSTGLVGNILIAFTIISYTTSIARQRAMRFAEMVLALASASVVSAAPSHVIQLMNLQVSQLTLTFYVSSYISICLSYTSSSINPFPYILPTGNFQKRLRRCTEVEVRMVEQDVNIIQNILKSSF